MAAPRKRLLESVWLRPLYENDGHVYFAICGQDSDGKLSSSRFRAKNAHVFVASGNVRAVVRRVTFSLHYRLLCDFGPIKHSAVFSNHSAGGRYASYGWKRKSPVRAELLSLSAVQATDQTQQQLLSTWVNCLIKFLKPPGLACVEYGAALSCEHKVFALPHGDCEPVSAELLLPAHVGLDARFDFLTRLGSWTQSASAAAQKAAFDPLNRFTETAVGADCLGRLDALPHASGSALKTLLRAAHECLLLSSASPDAPPGRQAPGARALLFSTRLQALASTTQDGVRAGDHGCLLWGPPRAQPLQLGACPSGAYWYGPLSDAPAGLLAAPLQSGLLAYYLHTGPAGSASADKTVLLQLLYNARTHARGGALMHVRENMPVHCLSAAPDGSLLPVSLEQASAFTFVLESATVDAADKGWSATSLLSLLACFRSVTFFNQDAAGGPEFEQRLRLLAGAPGGQPAGAQPAAPLDAPRPAYGDDLDMENYEYGELTALQPAGMQEGGSADGEGEAWP
jgi:hypothetical protein